MYCVRESKSNCKLFFILNSICLLKILCMCEQNDMSIKFYISTPPSAFLKNCIKILCTSSINAINFFTYICIQRITYRKIKKENKILFLCVCVWPRCVYNDDDDDPKSINIAVQGAGGISSSKRAQKKNRFILPHTNHTHNLGY